MNNKIVAVLLAASIPMTVFADSSIDPSDPTKIAAFAGPGFKFTSFADDSELVEIRASGNMGFGEKDMVLFELGYGNFDGAVISTDTTSGMTNARARWFHLFNMDGEVTRGYRGWATQVDLQLAGSVKGTTGSNTLAIGALPAFAINNDWDVYLPTSYVSTWGEDFNKHLGHGISITPMFVYAPENGMWNQFFLQISPSYTRYFAGDIENSGAGSIEFTTGGAVGERWILTAVVTKNFDKNFEGFRRPGEASGANDWNVFFSGSYYF